MPIVFWNQQSCLLLQPIFSRNDLITMYFSWWSVITIRLLHVPALCNWHTDGYTKWTVSDLDRATGPEGSAGMSPCFRRHARSIHTLCKIWTHPQNRDRFLPIFLMRIGLSASQKAQEVMGGCICQTGYTLQYAGEDPEVSDNTHPFLLYLTVLNWQRISIVTECIKNCVLYPALQKTM